MRQLMEKEKERGSLIGGAGSGSAIEHSQPLTGTSIHVFPPSVLKLAVPLCP
jgi:hypothetical protein